MKTKQKSLFIMGLSLAVIFFFGELFSKEKKGDITIQGYVEANETNEEGTVIEVIIMVEIVSGSHQEFEQYIVVDNKTGKNIINLVGEYIEATGSVEADDDGNKYITVTDFKIIQNNPQDDETEPYDFEEIEDTEEQD